MRHIKIINLTHSDRHDASITELCVLESSNQSTCRISGLGSYPKSPGFLPYTPAECLNTKGPQ